MHQSSKLVQYSIYHYITRDKHRNTSQRLKCSYIPQVSCWAVRVLFLIKLIAEQRTPGGAQMKLVMSQSFTRCTIAPTNRPTTTSLRWGWKMVIENDNWCYWLFIDYKVFQNSTSGRNGVIVLTLTILLKLRKKYLRW